MALSQTSMFQTLVIADDENVGAKVVKTRFIGFWCVIIIMPTLTFANTSLVRMIISITESTGT